MCNLEIRGDALVIEGRNNLHIDKVEVFTGNDDYEETCLLEIETEAGYKYDSPKLTVKERLHPKKRTSEKRLRYEPGVSLILHSENGDRFKVSFSHHKGHVLVDVASLPA